jgi:RimJ/RimL family protein N-acetyltransferase
MSRHTHAVGVFHIDPVPGQGQLAHCHGFYVNHAMRGRGYAHTLKSHQMERLAEERYDYATCTLDSANDAQRRVLEGAGWRQLAIFMNSKTGGTTELWGCTITKE